MADLVKATTPINNRNVVQTVKEQRDATATPFDFQDLTKVKQTLAQSNMNGQQNTIREDGSSTAMFRRLQSPEAATTFVRAVMLLRSIANVLLLNNDPQTEEINQLLDQLMLRPEQVPAEMQRQEQSATLFKGELFDLLRTVARQNSGHPEIQNALSGLLKAVYQDHANPEFLNALKNNLTALRKLYHSSKPVTEQIDTLTTQLTQAGKAAQTGEQKLFGGQKLTLLEFDQLKTKLTDAFRMMETSVLYSEPAARLISIARYNLSRYNPDPALVKDSFALLFRLLSGKEQPQELARAFQAFQEDPFSQAGGKSQTMRALADAVSGNGLRDGMQLFSNESMDKIINSLLSSPSNYTPLLHYVVPMQYEDTAAFAEVWVNPDAEDDRPEINAGGKPVMHVLFVFEVEYIGKFETELFVTGKNIELSVYCPEPYLEEFLGVAAEIRKAAENLPYRFTSIKIEKLTAERSLIDVFTSLPTRRAGLNVTI